VLSLAQAATPRSLAFHALLVLDGGACTVGIESTIIDCTRGAPVLLRPGSISSDQISAACGLKVLPNAALATTQAAPKSSGSLESHYAPKAAVRLMDASTLQSELASLADAELGSLAVYSRTVLKGGNSKVIEQRMPGDAPAAARELFAVLRALDLPTVKSIWVESPPTDSAWDGVRDRLQRAAASG